MAKEFQRQRSAEFDEYRGMFWNKDWEYPFWFQVEELGLNPEYLSYTDNLPMHTLEEYARATHLFHYVLTQEQKDLIAMIDGRKHLAPKYRDSGEYSVDGRTVWERVEDAE